MTFTKPYGVREDLFQVRPTSESRVTRAKETDTAGTARALTRSTLVTGPSNQPNGSLQCWRAARGSDRRPDSSPAQRRQRTDASHDERGSDAGCGPGGLPGRGRDLPRHRIPGGHHGDARTVVRKSE